MLRRAQVPDLPHMVHHTDPVVPSLLRARCDVTQLLPQIDRDRRPT